jgi:hypothetical protein
MPDFAKIDRVMDFIDKNPDRHYQGVWGLKNQCGTTACFAGWTVLMNGGSIQSANIFLDKDGKPIDSVGRYAAEILGLNDRDLDTMFLRALDRDDLHDHIEYMKERDGYVKPEPVPQIDIDELLGEKVEEVSYVQ